MYFNRVTEKPQRMVVCIKYVYKYLWFIRESIKQYLIDEGFVQVKENNLSNIYVNTILTITLSVLWEIFYLAL